MGGGLGDLLKGGLGGLLGGAAAGSVISGGLGDLLKQFQQQGQGEVADSWVGKGENKSIAPGDLGQALGVDQINALTSQTGLSRDDLLQRSQPVSARRDRSSDAGRTAADRQRIVGPDLTPTRPCACISQKRTTAMSGILWVILVGFVAGIIARILSPGPNNPSGFILTTVLGIAGAFLATLIGQSFGHYGAGPGRRLHHRDDRRADRAVHLEPAGGAPDDFRSGEQVTVVSRHCERSEAIHASASASKLDCFGSQDALLAQHDGRTISRNQMQPRIHPHQLAGHVARRRRREKTHQLPRYRPPMTRP